MNSPPIVHRTKPLTKNLRAPADEENAGDWTGKDSDGASSTDGEAEIKKKARDLTRPARERARAIAKAGEDLTLANLSFLERVSASHGTEAKHQKKIEQFLSFADKEKLALAVDDEVGAASVLCLNMSCSQERLVTDEETLLAELSAPPTPVREAEEKLARSQRTLKDEKTGSDTFKTTVAQNDLVSNLLGGGEKLETSDDLPYTDEACNAADLENSCSRCERT